MIAADRVSFSYDGTPVVDGVSLSVASSECVAVLGANGSGKSTLLKLLLGLLRPARGAVLVKNRDMVSLDRSEIARLLGYVEQTARIPEFSVFEAVLSGRLPHSGGRPGVADMEIAAETLGAMGLADLSGRRLSSLSGGQLQRVILARALAQRPGVLLLDEPTNHLDLRAQKEVVERIANATAQFGVASIVVLHDVNLALRLAHRLVFMKAGRVLATCRPGQVTAPLMHDVFGVPVDLTHIRGKPFLVPQWLED